MNTTSVKQVLVWDENGGHVPLAIYPDGIRGTLAALFNQHEDLQAEAVHLDQPAQGLNRLNQADLLVWWGHQRHGELAASQAEAIAERVRQGMGLMVLHSGHYSQPFKRVLNCSGELLGGWREDERPEELRVCAPWHPICQGIPDFTLAQEEMYGAPFDVPPPDAVLLQSYFPAGGESFPSGLVWTVGQGRVFYFRPGHETCPSYHHQTVQQLLLRAALWLVRRL